MSTVDERVVEMRFDNGQFEAGVKQTNKSLDDLKKGLDLSSSARSLDDLQRAGDRFSLAGIGNGVAEIGSKFTALGAIAFGALASIGAKAVAVGGQLVSSLTIDPIKTGLDEYNTNLNSVQTILANTQSSGATLKDVNGALNELNLYSDKTIYNFSEMARNIGTFTAAGVALKPATQSIKGIANLAALSGSNSQQASSAMYQLSQAISSGKVGLQDWNSVVNAGMGGTVFQRALAQTAVKMGTIQDSAVKLSGKMKNVKIDGQSFRDSISAKDGKPSWLTSDVLTKTLAQFTGDMTDAQLAAEGFTKSEIKAIQLQAKTASDAATQVKTLPQLISTLQESAQSGWSQSFQYIFGDFEQAKKLFTGVNNVIGGLISSSSNARNAVLKGWEEGGGRKTTIMAISNAFHALQAVLAPVAKAFREVFPATTSAQLIAFSQILYTLSVRLQQLADQYAPQIARTFKGVFAVLDIGRMIIVGLVKTIFGLFGQLGEGTGSVLDITAAIGDFLVSVRDAIKNGDGLTKFFQILGAVLKVPIALLTAITGAIADVFGGVDAGKALDDMSAKVQPLTVASDFLLKVWQRFGAIMGKIFAFVGPVASALGDMLGQVGQKISDALTNVNYDEVLSGLNTGLLLGITLLIKKFLSNGLKFSFSGDIGGGLFGSLKESFEGITGVLGAMQQNLKANVLLKIAGALAILTASMVALSLIDPAALTKASAAMVVMFTELGVAMALFGKISVGPGIVKMPALATAMVIFALAILVLTAAVKQLAGLDLGALVQGLGGVIVLLGAVAGTAKLMQGSTKGLIGAGIGMVLIASAIRILVGAVAELGAQDTGQMIQGLLGVAAALAIIAGFSRIVGNPAKLAAAGVGMVLIGAALNLVADAVSKFGSLSVEQIAKGIITMGVALGIIAVAMQAMPGPSMLISAAALVIVGAALNIIAGALQTLGGMSIDAIVKSLGTMAAALIILAGSLYLMEGALPGAAALVVAAAALAIMAPALQQFGSMDIEAIGKALGLLAASLIIIAASLYLMTAALPGAAALLVAAAALAILAPVLQALGSMSWDEIGRGLAVLAGAFVIIGVAGALLTPVIPTLLALGGAIALLGLGAALAGVGVLAFATGLTALGVAGVAGAAGLTASLTAVLNLIPLTLTKLGEGIVALAGVIEKGAPAIVAAIVAVIVALIDAIGTIAPKLIDTFIQLVVDLAQALAKGVPKLYEAGYKMLLGILHAIANNIGKVVTAGTDIIVNFLNGIGKNLPRVIDAGIRLIISFVNGLARGIREHTAEMRKAAGNLADAIIDGITGGLTDGVGKVIDAAKGMAKDALDAAKNLLGIHSPSKEFEKVGAYSAEGYALGLSGNQGQIQDAFNNLKGMLQDLLDSSAKDIEDYQDKIYDLTQSSKDAQKAVDDQQTALNDAKNKQRKGGYSKDEQKRLDDLTTARQKDTREIKEAQKALADAKKKEKAAGSAKTAKQRASQLESAKRAEQNARDRIEDLTNKRDDDTEAVEKQRKVLAQAKKDEKNGTYVADEQDKLNRLIRTRDKANKALADANEEYATASEENPKAQAAMDELTGAQAAQEAQLETLSKKYDDYDDKIKTATQTLDDATKTRNDYNKSIKEEFSSLDSITKDTTLEDYTKNLQQQVEDTLDFTSQLQALRSQGLNDKLYDKLLKTGTDAIPFVTQLLNSGQNGIQDLDELSNRLDAAASDLGSQASTNLYQAGVDAANGFLQGLQAEQDAIKAQMESIGAAMVTAIQNKLGIHSPSRVFAEVGGYTMEGLAGGMNDATGLVQKAAANAGDTAVSSLRRSIAGIASAVSDEMDLNPTIRPVLDLSAVQNTASTLGGILGRPVLSVSDAYNSAGAANDGYISNQEQMLAVKDGVATTSGTTYVQNNYSPKPLSSAEIYRNTKNQLSVAKGEND